ncbi:asparagine--tRNA ligase [bacterium M21]|nr:asparagine--tRNA ligase [bacterium M21]
MKKELIRNILTHNDYGSETVVRGWVRTRRDSKGGFSFLEINDGSCFASIQVVADKALPNYESEIQKLHPGSAVEITGKLVESPGAEQSVEVHATNVLVHGFVDVEKYPLQKKRISLEKLRELAHLRPRTNTFGAMTRVRNVLAKATHDFFQEQGFYYLNTPIITASDCEGAGEMFRVSTLNPDKPPRDDKGAIDWSKDFFAREACLTVSGQLSAETHACALGRVYTFGPTFRAENSNTSRHLSEFWMVEPEMAFSDLNDDADLAEEYLKFLITAVLNSCPDDLAFFNKWISKGLIDQLSHIVDNSFERLTYTEAVAVLQKADKAFEFPVTWGVDLQSEHERYLTEEHVGRPVILTDYPKEIKAFYMRQNDDGKTVRAMDVLVPQIGEIIGGSQREERLDVLEARITELGMDVADYWWYLDLRRFGTVPHAGFGLGFERMVQYCTGLSNIRDVIPFPRTPRHAEF